MTYTITNPNAPATSKQLWLLHILTKTDTRNLTLTMAEASAKIEALKNKPITKKSDTTSADYRISGIKTNNTPKPERVVIQGVRPIGETDMAKVNNDFMTNAYPIGRIKSGNDTATISFTDYNCKECLFGITGLCKPDWDSLGYVTCGGKVESVSFTCRMYEPLEYKPSITCHRPKGKQCHRKHFDNKCLECNFRHDGMNYSNWNRSAWYSYIPTIKERITKLTEEITHYDITNVNHAEYINRMNRQLELLKTLDK
jgi:hypothetical protein